MPPRAGRASSPRVGPPLPSQGGEEGLSKAALRMVKRSRRRVPAAQPRRDDLDGLSLSQLADKLAERNGAGGTQGDDE